MISLFQFILALHVAGGTMGLIFGTTSAIAQKGGKLHKVSGKIFFYSLLLASLAALILSNLPDHHNLFLFSVGGFTLYMIISGYRVVFLKRNNKKQIPNHNFLDYCFQLFGGLFGLFLLWMGINTVINGALFGIVPIIFGIICINFARIDFNLLYYKKPVPSFWLRNHIVRMMGAMIASYTAFLVVNVQIKANWILWLAPSLIGSILIAYFIRKFVPVIKSPKA